MAKTKEEVIEDIKKARPLLSHEEAVSFFETLETYCELIINYTLKNAEED